MQNTKLSSLNPVQTMANILVAQTFRYFNIQKLKFNLKLTLPDFEAIG